MIYLVSAITGLGVGAIYGLLEVRSPAPPVVALIGLLGILAGEHGVAAIKQGLRAARVGVAAAPAVLKTSKRTGG